MSRLERFSALLIPFALALLVIIPMLVWMVPYNRSVSMPYGFYLRLPAWNVEEGDVVQAVSHMRKMQSEIRRVVSMAEDELYEAAKRLRVPFDLLRWVHDNGRLPVVNFAAGGVATPADAALMMQLGAEGVFVGSGIFKSGNPAKRAAAIVQAVTNYNDPKRLAELSEDLGEAMVGINAEEIELLMAERGK